MSTIAVTTINPEQGKSLSKQYQTNERWSFINFTYDTVSMNKITKEFKDFNSKKLQYIEKTLCLTKEKKTGDVQIPLDESTYKFESVLEVVNLADSNAETCIECNKNQTEYVMRNPEKILEFLGTHVNFFFLSDKLLAKEYSEMEKNINKIEELEKLVEIFENTLKTLSDYTKKNEQQGQIEQLQYFLAITKEIKTIFSCKKKYYFDKLNCQKGNETKEIQKIDFFKGYLDEISYKDLFKGKKIKLEKLNECLVIESVRTTYNKAICLIDFNNLEKKENFKEVTKLLLAASRELQASKIDSAHFDSYQEDLLELLYITIEEKQRIVVFSKVIDYKIKRINKKLENITTNTSHIGSKLINITNEYNEDEPSTDYSSTKTGSSPVNIAMISKNAPTFEPKKQGKSYNTGNKIYIQTDAFFTLKDLIISQALKFATHKILDQKNSEESLQKIKGYEFEIQTSDNFYRAKVYNLALQGYMNTYKKMKLHEFRDGIEEKILYYKSFCLLLERIVQAREKLKDYFTALKFGLELIFNMVSYYPEILKPIENIVDKVIVNVVKQIYSENKKDKNNQFGNLTDRDLKYFKYKLADKLRGFRLDICEKKNQKTKDSFKIYKKDDKGDAEVDTYKLADQTTKKEWSRFRYVLDVFINIYNPNQQDCVQKGFTELYKILTNLSYNPNYN